MHILCAFMRIYIIRHICAYMGRTKQTARLANGAPRFQMAAYVVEEVKPTKPRKPAVEGVKKAKKCKKSTRRHKQK